jgi:hypothetical protein
LVLRVWGNGLVGSTDIWRYTEEERERWAREGWTAWRDVEREELAEMYGEAGGRYDDEGSDGDMW